MAANWPTGWQPPRAPTQGLDLLPVAHNEDYGGLQAADSKQYFIASVAPSVNATRQDARRPVSGNPTYRPLALKTIRLYYRQGESMRPHKLATWCFGLVIGLVLFAATNAKEPPPQVIVWPASGQPVLRFSFGKFKEIGSSGKQHDYTVDVSAENLWNKKIPRGEFTLYVFDKAKVRIGEAWIAISDLAPGRVVKFQTAIGASGTIASMELVPRSLPTELQAFLPPKTISIAVNSVPQGAELKIDGAAVGTTPKIVQASPGKHALAFSKEGFNSGTFPLEITPDDVSGGSVSYELGTSAHDTLELRDGSVLSGDVQSMSATEVLIRIGGTVQHLSRNQVKRVVLIQREPPLE